MKRWLANELSKNDHTRIGFWPLLKNDRDYSGRGNHATPVSGCDHMRAPGMNGYKISNNGLSTTYLSLGNCTDIAFDNNVPWSVSLWYFEQPTTDFHSLVSFTGPTISSGYAGWVFGIDTKLGAINIICTANSALSETCAGTAQFTSLGLYPLTNIGWQHLVLTYNGSQNVSGFHAYFNGRRIPITWSSTTIISSWVCPTPSQGTGYIGFNPSIDFHQFFGVVRLVQAWKRELSSIEVARRYAIERAVDTFGRSEARKAFSLYLFIHGHEPIDSTGENPYLFLEGGGPSNALPLFINAAQPFDSEPGLPLFINGVGSYPSSVPLFIESRQPVSGWIPLFLENTIYFDTSTMNLFLDASPGGTPYETMPLTVMGSSGDSGYAAYMPMFLEVGEFDSEWTSQMNLYTAGIDQGPYCTNMNLFTLGGTTSIIDSMPLYVWNSQSGSFASLPLTCWAGPTGNPGSLPFTSTFNLFIDRPTDGYSPLFIWGDSPASSSTPLFVHGSTYYPGNDNEVIQGLIGTQLVTQGFGQTPSMTLVLPNVVGSSYLPTIPFYVHGY